MSAFLPTADALRIRLAFEIHGIDAFRLVMSSGLHMLAIADWGLGAASLARSSERRSIRYIDLRRRHIRVSLVMLTLFLER